MAVAFCRRRMRSAALTLAQVPHRPRDTLNNVGHTTYSRFPVVVGPAREARASSATPDEIHPRSKIHLLVRAVGLRDRVGFTYPNPKPYPNPTLTLALTQQRDCRTSLLCRVMKVGARGAHSSGKPGMNLNAILKRGISIPTAKTHLQRLCLFAWVRVRAKVRVRVRAKVRVCRHARSHLFTPRTSLPHRTHGSERRVVGIRVAEQQRPHVAQ